MKKILFVILTFFAVFALYSKDETREKARYYFMQGSIAASQNDMAEAYEYFKKAYEIDPTYRDAGFTYGSQRMFLRTDTMQTETELKRSLRLMGEYIDDNPTDLYATQLYGYITTALDTVEESIRVYNRIYKQMPSETDILMVLADAYMRNNQGPEAIETLNKYEEIEGKSKDLSLKKITFMLALQDTTGALEETNRLVEANPRDPYTYILKGNLYDVIGDMDSVVKAYKAAESIAPDNGTVKMSLAQYYRATGDSVMLDNMIYEALLSEDFELEDKLGILGDYLQKLIDDQGDKTRGDHLFSVLQSQYPHEPDVLEMAARYDGAKGDFEGAAEAISYARDMDPANEKYWLMLLSYQLAQSKYEDIINIYEEAQTHIEPSVAMKNVYAGAATMLPDTTKTKTILLDLLNEIDPSLVNSSDKKGAMEKVRATQNYDDLVWTSTLYCMLGDLYYKEGHNDEGFEEYENSLYFFPDNALTLNNYAYFLSEEDRDLEKAHKMSRRSLDLVDKNPTYLDTFAWILYKQGNYAEAMDYIKLAIELAKDQEDDNEEYLKHYEAIEKALKASEESSD